MKKRWYFLLCCVVFGLAACTNRLAPVWYQTMQPLPNTLAVKHTAQSDTLELAIRLAEERARKMLTEQVGAQARELRAALEKEIDLDEQPELLDFFNKRLKAVVTAHLYKIEVKKQNTVKKEDVWHTFILVEYPLAEANKALVEEFKRNTEMYEHIQKAPSFVALEKQVELAAQ